MQVREIMTSDPVCCTPDTDLQRVAEMMVQHDCGAIPVVDNNDSKHALGIVTDRDIVTRVIAKGNNPLQMRARDAMTEQVITISDEASLEEAEKMMEDNQVRRLIVESKESACVGILAQADIARHAPADQTKEVLERISQPSDRPSVPA